MNKTVERVILICVAIFVTISVTFWSGLLAGLIPVGGSFAIHFASEASQSKEKAQRIKYTTLFIVSVLVGILGAILSSYYKW